MNCKISHTREKARGEGHSFSAISFMVIDHPLMSAAHFVFADSHFSPSGVSQPTASPPK